MRAFHRRRRARDVPVAYPEGPDVRERTRAAVADPVLRANLHAAAGSWARGRERMRREEGLDAMRARAREIRAGNIRDMPALLARLEERVRDAGGVVVRAADRQEAARYVVDVARARGASVVAKSKSMATEEIKLNEALEDAGLRVVETDLGEWILQLAGERPAHIIAPAVHLSRGQITEDRKSVV